jgi:bifunctional enzyme CysN/CysC
MKWYHGKSMMEYLETVHVSSDHNFDDLRFPVQYVLRPDRDFRGFSGRIASGVLKTGDEVMVLPSMKKSMVKSIMTCEGKRKDAFPPQSVTITLKDEIDISRGEMIIHPDNVPRVDRHFESMLVWMDETMMDLSKTFYIKHNTNTSRARIDEVQYKIDVNTLKRQEKDKFVLNDIGRVVITTNKPLFFDPYRKNRNTGSFILIDPVTHNTCAVGMILDKRASDKLPSRITDIDREKIRRGKSLISTEQRTSRYGHKGSTIWITGMHGSGKNDLAYTLEKQLFDIGASVVLLDGSTVRSGLSRELDYSPADRTEHLRRVAHIARILNDQGIITICSFISPDNNIRNQVKEIIGGERFILVHMDEDINYCRANKPDLYEQADNGKISNVPGLDTAYEAPEKADFVLNHKNTESNLLKIVHAVFPE